MNDLREFLGELRRRTTSGHASVVATIVKVAGSTYRRPGARMLFSAEGPSVGLLSGGCLEADLGERAARVLETGEPRTVVYDMRSPDDVVWGLGLGCNGEIRVLLEHVVPGQVPGWVAFLERCSERRETGILATVFHVEGQPGAEVGARMQLDGAGRPEIAPRTEWERAVAVEATRMAAGGRSSAVARELAGGRLQFLLEYVSLRTALVVMGAGSDARPLARMGRDLGWRVVVADGRPDCATSERNPEADAVHLLDYDDLPGSAPPVDRATAVVIMTHHFHHDLDLLAHLLPSPAPYVGLLGPRQRRELLLRELVSRGVVVPPARLAALHAPAGLDIGSETPEEIALSILAEIRAVLCGRSGGFLRDSPLPLHPRDV